MQGVDVSGVALTVATAVSGLNVQSTSPAACPTSAGPACNGTAALRCCSYTVGDTGVALSAGAATTLPSVTTADGRAVAMDKPLSISLLLRTLVTDAVVLSAADPSGVRYVEVGVSGGQPYAAFDYGGALVMAALNASVADGGWHAVQLTRTSSQAVLVVDTVAVTATGDATGDGWQAAYGAGQDGQAAAYAVYNDSAATLAWCAHRCLDDNACVGFTFRPAMAVVATGQFAPVTVLPPLCELAANTAVTAVAGFTFYALLAAASPVPLTVGGAQFTGCVASLVLDGVSAGLTGPPCPS